VRRPQPAWRISPRNEWEGGTPLVYSSISSGSVPRHAFGFDIEAGLDDALPQGSVKPGLAFVPIRKNPNAPHGQGPRNQDDDDDDPN